MRLRAVFTYVGLLLPILNPADSAIAAGMGTAFTYQGQLAKAGVPLDDTCDMTFGLFDASAGGNAMGASPQGPLPVDVAQGLFTTTLDFGDLALDGTARWLEISVQCTGDAMPTTLSPRVELTPAPHALALPGLYTQQNATSPNLIGGYDGNQVIAGVVGATIGGGGRADDGSGFQNHNIVSDHYGTVGGGRGNLAGDNAGTTGDQQYATVAGGIRNKAIGLSCVGGGSDNTASASFATIGGGNSNQAASGFSTIAGGALNDTTGLYSFVGGGENNAAQWTYASVVGGSVNRATAQGAAVVGGEHNTAGQIHTFIGGGGFNNATGNYSAVSGGNSHDATGDYSFVGGGVDNTAGGMNSTVSGGTANIATGTASTIGGGNSNDATGPYSTVGGGDNNLASTNTATVSGGSFNKATGVHSSVGGGIGNEATGFVSTIPGGQQNVAAGSYSFASGRRAKANHSGSVVWGGVTDADFASTAADQFLIRATGGVGIGTDSPTRPLHVAGDAQVDGTMWASTLSSNSPLALQTAGTTRIFADDVSGNVGVGTITPSEALHVAGSAQIDGTTKTPIVAGGSALELQTAGGTRMFLDDVTGMVGVGTSSPDDQLHVFGNIKLAESGSVGSSYIGTTASGTTSIQVPSSGGAQIEFEHLGSDSDRLHLITHRNNVTHARRLTVDEDGKIGIGTQTPANQVDVVASSGSAVRAENSAGIGVQGRGTTYGGYFQNIGSSATRWGAYGFGAEFGLHGDSPSTGVFGTAGTYGVYGSASTYGTYGQTFSTTGGVGVWGRTVGSGGTAYAVYGQPNSGHWAGYFAGAVHVAGTLSKAAGAFKIDHPLDPENKYLSHSFVESPDMKNIYDGTVTLDTRGEAWITLPTYFEALNKDFRYQLTAIGGAAPNLHVAEEVAGNKFKISGGPARGRVSWQVTGIRQDAYANAHRIQVEEDKKADERGKYLSPEVHGQPIEKTLNRLDASDEQRTGPAATHDFNQGARSEGGSE